MLTAIREDTHSVLNRDPAAHTVLEVLICHQGLHALRGHRIAHWFRVRHFYLIGRMISQLVRRHPRPQFLPQPERHRLPDSIGVTVDQLVER